MMEKRKLENKDLFKEDIKRVSDLSRLNANMVFYLGTEVKKIDVKK